MSPLSMDKSIQLALNHLKEISSDEKHVSGISTGFGNLDNYTGGLKTGELIVWSSYYFDGLYTLALNLATNVSKNQNVSVLYVSTQRKIEGIMLKLIASIANIELKKLNNSTLTIDEKEVVEKIVETIKKEYSLFLQCNAAISIEEIYKNAAEVSSGRHKVGLIIIDSLENLKKTNECCSSYKIKDKIHDLKKMAMEIGCCIILLGDFLEFSTPIPLKNINLSKFNDWHSLSEYADYVCILQDCNNYDSSMERWMELCFVKSKSYFLFSIQFQLQKYFSKFKDTFDD